MVMSIGLEGELIWEAVTIQEVINNIGDNLIHQEFLSLFKVTFDNSNVHSSLREYEHYAMSDDYMDV